jgi:hypothetical protein
MTGKDILHSAFERIPPKFRRTGRSQKDNWNGDPITPDPFDQISPIAIGQSQLRDYNGLLGR